MTRPRLLVGVGGSAATWPSLTWALAEAGRAGKDLVIFYACPPDSALAAPGAGARMSVLELTEPPLARAIASARLRLGGERVSVVVRPEPPGDLLVAAATPADLLVVGAPARPGWLERGSTTHHVVRHAPCPVVVVPPAGGGSHARPAGPAGPPAAPLRGHVLVGVDGSAAARSALEFGFAYAAEHRRPLAAVNVAAHIDSDIWYDDRLLQPHLTAQPVALDLLAVEVEPWQHKYPEVAVKRVLVAGRPVAGLLRMAAGATLLCLGTVGGLAQRRILGSVSHGVVDAAPCPVAVVHPEPARVEAVT